MKHLIEQASIVFSNGVRVVNTTPHPINFLDGDELVVCPSCKEVLVNATTEEEVISDILVKTVFLPNEPGRRTINCIKKLYPDAIIVGSIIACNAYKDVVGLTPVKGFERVPPAEKRMNIDKFNVGECY